MYDPLRGEPSPDDGDVIHVDAPDVEPVGAVLAGRSESYSGGAPWAPLTDTERAAVERLMDRLTTGQE